MKCFFVEARKFLKSENAPSSIREMLAMHSDEFSDIKDACDIDPI